MKAVKLIGVRDLVVKEFEKPVIKNHQVLIKVKASGICGSDLHFYRRTKERMAEVEKKIGSFIPGHEPAGIVEKVGKCVRNVKVGDEVAVYHWQGCGYCENCMSCVSNVVQPKSSIW